MANVALGRPVAEPVENPTAATDGQTTGYTGSDGFAAFVWPGYLTVDLGEVARLRCIRVLLWDGLGKGSGGRDPRGYKYRVLTSSDRRSWWVLFDSGVESSNGWQVFHLRQALEARYVRIHGLQNTANHMFQVVQVEAHDDTPPPLEAEVMLEREIGQDQMVAEHRDGLPLEHSVAAIVRSLEDLVAAHQILNPKPFRELISQLRLQVTDVSALERRMGSVRRQLVEPVREELARGRRYSVGGYWFGLAGGLFGLLSLALYVYDRLAGK